MERDPLPSVWPLVGRNDELTLIQRVLDDAAAGRSGALILRGEAGVGKTRLAQLAATHAAGDGWTVLSGSAYPVETGIPYALFADALVPALRELGDANLSLLSRGAASQLAYIFPALGGEPPREPAAGGPELKARVLWTVAQLLAGVSTRAPVLLVLENLHWADPSSLEMLHFVLRQTRQARLAVIATYNDREYDTQHTLQPTVTSLVDLGVATHHPLTPLEAPEVDELLQRVFGIGGVPRDTTAMLFEWTRGNPFFIQETVKALIAAHRLEYRDRCWVGWDLEGLELPRSVRDALMMRIMLLGPVARTVADVAGVIGTRLTVPVLQASTDLELPTVLSALDELCRRNVLEGHVVAGQALYDFSHPMVRDALYAQLGVGRAALLHAQVANALERHYGAQALVHADELAFHFAHASLGALTPKAVRYLTLAGRSALEKHASREAAQYLASALAHLERPESGAAPEELAELRAQLALAEHRLGRHGAAIALWERSRAAALDAGDMQRAAAIERRLALTSYAQGRHGDGLQHAHEGLTLLGTLGRGDTRARALRAQLGIARGACLMELGRAAECIAALEQALADAEGSGDAGVQARVHRALLLASIVTCAPEAARVHAARTLELATASNQLHVAASAYWALGVLAGLTGNVPAMEQNLREAERIAAELRSPSLQLANMELSVEHLAGLGEWTAALAQAEQGISLARALGYNTLLPRLLVWTAVLYVGRGELARAEQYLDEASVISGASGPAQRVRDVNSVLRVHMGRAVLHNARGQYDDAIRVSREGLALADRSGHAIWAIYRLWPSLIEAHLWKREFDEAERLCGELRRASAVMDHRLGLAWAEAGEALVQMLRGTTPALLDRVIRATEELERVPFVFDAARLRREIARRYVELGDHDEAAAVLAEACALFERMGAAVELAGAREQLRELGVTPHVARRSQDESSELTEREIEIARCVADNMSNKDIAKALKISYRTVGTHLHNIYRKLNVDGRLAVADYVRRGGLLGGVRAGSGAPSARPSPEAPARTSRSVPRVRE